MAFAQAYAEVVWPDRRRVLGKVLLPLTIEQALCLWRLGSPFMAGGEVREVRTHQVTLALLVLTRPGNEAARMMQERRAAGTLRAWRWQLWLRGGLEAAIREIAAHIDQSFEGPALWVEEGGSKSGAPYLQWLKCSLMECFGASREEALNYPVREAIWDIACFAESHARAEWVSEEDSDSIERIALEGRN